MLLRVRAPRRFRNKRNATVKKNKKNGSWAYPTRYYGHQPTYYPQQNWAVEPEFLYPFQWEIWASPAGALNLKIRNSRWLLGLGRYFFGRISGWLFIPDIRHITIFLITLQLFSVRMSVCPSKRPYICLSVRPSICNMYELLLTYCYNTKYLRNYSFVRLFKGIFFVKYKSLNYRISFSGIIYAPLAYDKFLPCIFNLISWLID